MAARTARDACFCAAVTLRSPIWTLFDLSKKVSYGWKPVDAWTIWALFAYAAVYCALFLAAGTLRFRKQAL